MIELYLKDFISIRKDLNGVLELVQNQLETIDSQIEEIKKILMFEETQTMRAALITAENRKISISAQEKDLSNQIAKLS